MPEGVFQEILQEKKMLLMRTVELERELMKARRSEKVLHEMEQRYLALMESGFFLYVVLTPSGLLRVMNRRAEEFFGFQLKMGMEITLQSLSGPGYTGETESLLLEAVNAPVHASMPFVGVEGTLTWLNLSLSWSTYQGESAIVLVAVDASESAIPSPSGGSGGGGWALQMLACCPGLLCFAVDRNGMLLYATRGYREVAKRFLGHECASGFPYPAEPETAFDAELRDLIRNAFRGDTSTTTVTEKSENGERRWNVTAAPLILEHGSVGGAVVHLTSMAQPRDGDGVSPAVRRPEPQVEELPDIHVPQETIEFSQLELLNSIRRMLVVLDDEGRCVEANACFLQTLKFRRDDVVGRPFAELAMPGDPLNDGLADKISQLTGKGAEGIECKICGRDGEIFALGLNASSVRWGTGFATLVSCADNTRLRRTEEQLKRMSSTDRSTGTLNRHGMERVLGTEIERAIRYRGSLTMIMLDIDGFRGLNERIGYAASDRILKELAMMLRSRIRPADFLGRWGGDEFLILTSAPISTARQLAETLRDRVDHQAFGDGIRLTLSAGVAEFRKSMDISAFVACAYDAMTEAKRGGGNRSVQATQPEPEESASFSAE